ACGAPFRSSASGKGSRARASLSTTFDARRSQPFDWCVGGASPGTVGARMGARSHRPDPTPEVIRDRVQSLPRRFRPDAVNGLAAEWELRVGSQTFAVSVVDHSCFVREGSSVAPQTVVATEPETWLAIDEGLITGGQRSEEHTSELQSRFDLVCRLLLEKKKI